MAPRPAPPVAVQPDFPAPSPKVPNLPPTAISPRVTILPSVFTPDKPPNQPVSPAPVLPAPCTKAPSPALIPAILEPDRDDPVYQSRYHLWPRARLYTPSRLQAGTQPCYVAALSQLLQQEEQANIFIDPASGQALEYRNLIRGPDRATWVKALANDLGRRAQGVGTCMPTSTNTVFFVAKSSIPYNRKVTYARMVATIQPTKAEVNRVRVTVGGNRLDFPGTTTTHCAILTTTKCLLDSIISNPGACFMTLDIKYFYYGKAMALYEYMKLALACIPDEIVKQYSLCALSSDGWVCLKIRKGMPGLKQAGRIANGRIKFHLAHFLFAPVPRSPALWEHTTKPIIFFLVVNNFGVKYISK